MRVITLNTWGGRAGKDKLLSFFDTYKESTDIFCLQEVWSAPYEHLEGVKAGGAEVDHSSIMTYGMQDISRLLSEYQAYFRPHHLNNYGLMMLVKKSMSVMEEGEVFVYKHKGYVPEGDVGNHARNIQYATLETGARPVTVINFHGLWNGKGKTDTEDRLDQSRKILEFIRRRAGECVLCGDFNLLPDTQSIQMFERAGLRNLIMEYGITSTRTSYYVKPEKYADYVFVTPNIKVNDLVVLPEQVSDHLALQLDIG